MRKIKVYFVDFWENFDVCHNHFTDALTQVCDLEITSRNPDLLFYSWLGDNHKYFKCHKIYFTPENLAPRYRECDFALSFMPWNDGKNLRYPNYLLYNYSASDLIKVESKLKNEVDRKTGFCSFVVSNPQSANRVDFFHKLNKYKKVDSGGRYLNNTGGFVKNKREFLGNYKFNIAFENCISNGYTTEKIVDAMVALSIPIYWGNPTIAAEFNTKSFFNFLDYQSEDDMIEDIIAHDRDLDKYYNKFLEPWFIKNTPNEYFDETRLTTFFKNIVDNLEGKIPISRNWPKQSIYYPFGNYINHWIGKLR